MYPAADVASASDSSRHQPTSRRRLSTRLIIGGALGLLVLILLYPCVGVLRFGRYVMAGPFFTGELWVAMTPVHISGVWNRELIFDRNPATAIALSNDMGRLQFNGETNRVASGHRVQPQVDAESKFGFVIFTGTLHPLK